MLSEVETVKHLDNAVFVRVAAQDTLEKLGLDARIICLLFLVLADLDCQRTSTVLHVNAANNLAKGAGINYLVYQVAVT